MKKKGFKPETVEIFIWCQILINIELLYFIYLVAKGIPK